MESIEGSNSCQLAVQRLVVSVGGQGGQEVAVEAIWADGNPIDIAKSTVVPWFSGRYNELLVKRK